MEALIPLLAAIKDPALLVESLCLLGLGWLYYTERKENRADRQQLMDLHLKVVDALHEIKVVIAAGRAA